MKVYISIKQIKKRARQVDACPYELNPVPDTLRQLISTLVLNEVKGYNLRIKDKESTAVHTKEEIDDMSQVGSLIIPDNRYHDSIGDCWLKLEKKFLHDR